MDLKEWSDGSISKGVQNVVTGLVHVSIEVFSVDLNVILRAGYFDRILWAAYFGPVKMIWLYLVVVGFGSGEFTADEVFILVVEFVWSDNNGVNCAVGGVNSLKCVFKLWVSEGAREHIWCNRFKTDLTGKITLQTESGVAFPEPKAFSRFLQSHSSSETIIKTVFLSLPGIAFLKREVNLSMAKSWRQRKSCPLPSKASKSVH